MRTARVVDAEGTPRSDATVSYGRASTYGIYRYADLVDGEGVLLRAGLLREHDQVLYPEQGLQELAQADDESGCEALVAALLEKCPPLWLLGATSGGEYQPELIPDDEAETLESVLDPEAREALLLRLGLRFSDDDRRQTGALAEEHVVSLCRSELLELGKSDLAAQVRRVSLISDQLGYDVTAPTLHGETRRIECKGTRETAPDNARVFLSRNEAERGLDDENWSLVVCRVGAQDEVELLGWCSGPQVEPFLPADAGSESRWVSVELSLPLGVLAPGLPPVH